MESHQLTLTAQEFSDLNQRFPVSPSSADIGKRAVEIVKIHFTKTSLGCQFIACPAGGDLAVLSLGCAQPKVFEIKGTAAVDLAWQQLKVSSQSSFDLLTSGAASVLRVTNVFGREPVIHELRCGEDFHLVHEPRWTFRRVRKTNRP